MPGGGDQGNPQRGQTTLGPRVPCPDLRTTLVPTPWCRGPFIRAERPAPLAGIATVSPCRPGRLKLMSSEARTVEPLRARLRSRPGEPEVSHADIGTSTMRQHPTPAYVSRRTVQQPRRPARPTWLLAPLVAPFPPIGTERDQWSWPTLGPVLARRWGPFPGHAFSRAQSDLKREARGKGAVRIHETAVMTNPLRGAVGIRRSGMRRS